MIGNSQSSLSKAYLKEENLGIDLTKIFMRKQHPGTIEMVSRPGRGSRENLPLIFLLNEHSV